MKTKIFLLGLFSLILIITSSCKKENTGIHQAVWLQEMIISLETNDFYWGSKIYRHDWKSEYYYHLTIPLSSCAYCNVYKENGQEVNWALENLEVYLAERDNEVIIWEWNKE